MNIPNSYRIAKLNFNSQAIKMGENQFDDVGVNPYMKVRV